MLWEIGEKRNEAKCVIHIFESILERWVPFSDNMAESVSWPLLLQFFSELELLLTLKLFVLFEMCFNFSKFIDHLVVLENFKIFHVEVGFVGALKLLLWLSWVDSFQDAKSSEILKRQLKPSDSVRSCDELSCISLGPRFNLVSSLFSWHFGMFF